MMSGLDRIIEKINADSLASCREIADQAQKKAQDIAEDANAHAEKAYSDIIADAEKKAQSILNMSEANISGIARRAELSAKVEAVDAAIEAAYDAMCNMGADDYFAALEKLAVRNACKGEGEMRLSKADLDRVLVIDEAKRELTFSDERIEKAITQNGARLIILDPIQAYMGEKTDMNRANEVRPMFRRLADVAERTGCAVILIGHLNKAAGGQSAYRGLGSIDFRAAARSVLLIGRVKREPNVRVIVHDKSSLAPEGKPVAFCLDPETGFSWIGEYDITADELLSGAGGNTATKTEQAERLILDLLADGKELASEDIVKAAAEAGISERTVQNAKRNMGGILGARRVGGQWYNFIKKKQPPEPAS